MPGGKKGKSGEFSGRDRDTLLDVGVDLSAERPTFALVNDRVVVSEARGITQKGLRLLSLHRAREEFGQVADLSWKLVSPDRDEFTRRAHEADADGYFIHVPAGTRLELPVQACFFIKLSGYTQTVHNLILLDQGAELHITNGCAIASYLDNGSHLGITEIYVGKGASLTYTMIHHWAEDVEVRPRTGARVEEGGTYISNYISLRRARHVQTSPVVELVGPGARTHLSSVIYAHAGSTYDVGGTVRLLARGTSAEISSRSVSDGGVSVAPSMLEANAPGVRGHVSCDGLMLSDGGEIKALPSLVSHVQDASLTHEAAVGRISDEEMFYLTARGLSPEQATSLIVRGFLSVRVPGIPPAVQANIDRTMELIGEKGF